MKKIFTLVSLLFIAFVLTACSSTPAGPVTRSGFLQKTDVKTVSYVKEHCEYSVSYQAAEKSPVDAKLTFSPATSYLKTDLSVVTGDGSFGEAGKDYYLFEAETRIEGRYTIDDIVYDFSNLVTSKAYFLGVGDALKPVYSEKTVNASSPESLNGKLSLKKYVYKITTEYKGNKAVVGFFPDKEASTGEFSLDGGYEKDKIFDGNYFDNEQLLFAPRAMALAENFSTSFKSLDAVSKSLNDVTLSYLTGDSALTKISFDEGGYVLHDSDFDTDEQVSSCNVVTLALKLSSTYSGATQRLSFAASSENKQYSRLIYMAIPATYGTGEFLFKINRAEISFIR